MKNINKFILTILVFFLLIYSIQSIIQIYELKEQITDNEKEYRYYNDIDFWNDMWAECEYGNRNYEIVRKEYGRYGD